ncbi:MAG: undecaprenyldiphospho-muramoylpentapeptide beta-N-acetylglucosaminyltransferase [Caldimicrobium sp.]
MKWVIVAGGTGGHLIPGIAIAEELLQMGDELLFMAGNRQIERFILKDRPFSVYHLDVEGFVGRSLKDKIRASFKLLKAFNRAYKILREFSPHVILAEGGYVSVPVVLAGKVLKKKIALHEQNLIPGKANLLLSKLVDRVFISFAESKKYFPEKKILFSGNPVRKDLLVERKREHQGRGLLVLGGSLGARFINQLILETIEELYHAVPNLYLIHQTGHEDFEVVKNAYEKLPLWEKYKERIKIFPFIEDMGWAYSQADLVLGRAGATTIAELIALKKPAILIPYPYATQGHQEKNAEVLTYSGCALMFKQDKLDKKVFLMELKDLLLNNERLEKMSEAYKNFGVKAPEKVIIEEMKKLVKGN